MTDPDERFDDQFESWLDRHQVQLLGPAPGTYERIARAARRRRMVRVSAVAAATVVALTGMGGIAFRIAAGPGPAVPPGASASSWPSVPASPGSPSPQPSASPEPAEPSATQSQSSRCHTTELKVTAQSSPGGGAAGSVYYWLVFTNVSARTCTLYGYPGVSWVTWPAGRQVNAPLWRMPGQTPTQVILAPQASGHAVVQQGNPAMFEPHCRPVQVAGFRVYPPDETASVFVPWPVSVCSVNGVDQGGVSPIVSGLSE